MSVPRSTKNQTTSKQKQNVSQYYENTNKLLPLLLKNNHHDNNSNIIKHIISLYDIHFNYVSLPFPYFSLISVS